MKQFLLRQIFVAILFWSAPMVLLATPVNKAALQRHYGSLLGAGLDRCSTCHLPSANRNPESLDEFPHNPFGSRLRALGKSKDIRDRLDLIAREDSDDDGVKNEIELLLGGNPGDGKDKPNKTELSKAGELSKKLKLQLAAYPWEPFQTPKQSALPKATSRNWRHNPIDRFIASEHKARGLKARPAAPKDILLRRVYLDLIGLSPSPQEIAAFAADDSANAYEQVVDRLLKDSRYGERWGRHWMDVWRYSDWAGWSGGNQIRDSQPHIWRWRDWIIESLNDDKPYDKMIVEMLAADELAAWDTNALRATGFLVRNYKMLSREQWLEDTVKHTSQAFLGITMGCAKCHNHMYDPISQKEYYQFRAIFEPHQVRTDRLPGQPDTAKDGLVRVYDIGTNAITYFFNRGDERRPDTNRIMEPGVPRALQGKFAVEKISLPSFASYPDKRTFVFEDLLRESATALESTKESERELAQAKHDSLAATLRAEQMEDDGRKGTPEWEAAAKAANKAQRLISLFEAKRKLEESLTGISKTNGFRSSEVIDKEKAEKKKVEAETKLAEAQKDYDAEPTTDYTPRKTSTFPDTSTGRRLALARWIANAENPLTARVAVNHIWLRHFGQGLVPTPADFGLNGKPPTNPALLDWLAAEFAKNGWSMKALHRLIVTSATYRMASTPDSANAKIDPDNNYLWRMPSRRMEGELVRDNLLHIAKDLDPTMGGPEIDHNEGLTSKRRSVYLRSAAEKEVEFLKIFDGPSVAECYVRHPSVVPQQALALANSKLALAEARRLSEKLKSANDFVEQAFLCVLAREPKSDEYQVCREFLAAEEKKTSPERARQNLVLVLFNHNDFVTIR